MEIRIRLLFWNHWGDNLGGETGYMTVVGDLRGEIGVMIAVGDLGGEIGVAISI